MAKILIIDDNPDVLDALDLLLGLHQYQTVLASTEQQALLALERQKIDAVIQDMNFTQELTSGNEGKSLFYKIKAAKPDLPIILITAWTQLETAIELVKAGAWDYLPKPWDDQKLLSLLEKLNTPVTTHNTPQFVFHSEVMKQLVAQATKVATSDVNLLITGANGCGKEVLADYVHQGSQRAKQPFIKVNIGAIPPELMEAELFGAEKGAFTSANSQRLGRFEAADNGTLFLDEIGNLSLAGQMKLLRVLQTGEFERLGSNTTRTSNVRVICATNADLETMVKRGEFRENLWFRLNVIELHLPDLKERKADILPLAKHFLGTEYQLDASAEKQLTLAEWPGNVRQLQNACERAKVFASSHVLSAQDFQLQPVETIDEKQQIINQLKAHNWVIKQAAQSLGLSRQALYRRIEKYQISEPEQ